MSFFVQFPFQPIYLLQGPTCVCNGPFREIYELPLGHFTLFDAGGIAANEAGAFTGSLILLAGAVVLFTVGSIIFCRKDLHL